MFGVYVCPSYRDSGESTFLTRTAERSGCPKGCILLSDDIDGESARMEWRKVGGIEDGGMEADLRQVCHHGMRQLGL